MTYVKRGLEAWRWLAVATLTTAAPNGLNSQSASSPIVRPTVGVSVSHGTLIRSAHALANSAGGFKTLNDGPDLTGRTVTVSGGVRVGPHWGVVAHVADWREDFGRHHATTFFTGPTVWFGGRDAVLLHLGIGRVSVPVDARFTDDRFDDVINYVRTQGAGSGVQVAAGYERRLSSRALAQVLAHWATASPTYSPTGLHMHYRAWGVAAGLTLVLNLRAGRGGNAVLRSI